MKLIIFLFTCVCVCMHYVYVYLYICIYTICIVHWLSLAQYFFFVFFRSAGPLYIIVVVIRYF